MSPVVEKRKKPAIEPGQWANAEHNVEKKESCGA
jgi:hypothetical protein